MIRLYTALLYLLLPLAGARLWWRGRRQPGYRRHWRERLGDVPPVDAGGAALTWLHAVSVGEVRAAAPLVRALLRVHPDRRLLITTATPTGRATVRQLFGDRVRCAFLPWDLPFAVERFVARLRPACLIVMETELWPNLFHTVRARGVPLYLVNARLSARSFRAYRRARPLLRDTLACVTRIAAQAPTDAERFRALGARPDRVAVAGNLKFEHALPGDFASRCASLRETLGRPAWPWLAGSTHPGEEALLLSAHRRLLEDEPRAVLWLAPRHPERAADVVAQCERAGFTVARFSRLREQRSAGSRTDAQVIVVDVLGVLVYLYGMAPVAFIGGSLAARGGHNPLEALQAGCAVLTGRWTDNFAEVYAVLRAAGAVTLVDNEVALAEGVGELWRDGTRRARQVAAGQRVIEQRRGALARTLALIGETPPARV